jgi:hypothetical protein
VIARLFDFADGGQQYQIYRDEEHFVYCYATRTSSASPQPAGRVVR